MDVRIEAAAADDVAARGWHAGAAGTGEQRAREQERRADPARELRVHLRPDVLRVDAHLVVADPLHLGANAAQQPHHRLDVADARHVRQFHRLVGEEARCEDRERGVLVPGRTDATRQRATTFDHERLRHWPGNGRGHGGHYASPPVEKTRADAWETLTKYTKSDALLRHALAVEASTASYASRFDGDEELWRVAALLHDFDYEIHPTLDKHPQDGAPILRDEGYPEEVVETILSHANHLGLPRDTPLKKTLFACDELSGFVHACGLVRPTGLEGLEPKSVKKKLKQPSFASGVHREDVYKGAEELGVDLDDHIRTVVEALQPISAELGLPA